MRSLCISLLITGLPLAVMLAAPAAAQVDESKPVKDSGEEFEEIAVYGGRSGDPEKADPIYAEMLRKQMLEEVQRMRLEEESQWRNSDLTYQSNDESRIVWGYDPKADRDRRENLDLNTMPGDTVKPATLFRAKF